MGFWNDGIRDRSRSRSRSPSRRKHSSSQSQSQNQHYSSRPSYARSASSFFSLGNTSTHSHHSTSGSTSRGGHSSRARPRSGFVARLRKFIRDLYNYMRRHPVKVFMLVIMPLITGGALTKILAQFGVRLPRGLEQFVGGGNNSNVRREAERFYARGGARDFGGGSALPGIVGGLGGMSGMGEGLGSLMGLAKMFM